jgi:polar amino acid transport system substrate-binding protein
MRPRGNRACVRLVLLSVLTATAAGCGLPHDAEGTLDRVNGGSMRVGGVVNPPWLDDSGGSLHGIEASLVQSIADDVGARVFWVHAPEATLMESLHRRELDLVVGGLTADLPWVTKVAFTRPFATVDGRRHVLAAPPGENAWLVRVERVLERQRPAVAALTARTNR